MPEFQTTTFQTTTGEETIELGRRFAREWPRKAVVLLIGDLGAGKTTLAKGIVSERTGAPIEEITSPTFTLIHEYGDPSHLAYHIDLYRLDTEREIASLGLEELFDREALVLIEWGERFPKLIPSDAIRVRISSDEHETRRFVVERLC